VLIVMMLWYGVMPSIHVLLVPPLVIVLSLAGLGVGTLLAALNVAYRDFRYVIPFLVQLWMFATPSVYMQVGPTSGTGSAPALTEPDYRPDCGVPRCDPRRTDPLDPSHHLRRGGAGRFCPRLPVF
jgi:hypothetical protein